MCSWKINAWCIVFAVLLINACMGKPYTESRPGFKKAVITPVRNYRLIAGSVPDDLDSLQPISQPAVEEAKKPENVTESAVPQEDLKSEDQTEDSIDKVSTEDVAGPAAPTKPANELALLIQTIDLANLLRPLILIRSFINAIMTFFFSSILGMMFARQ